jgi:hypothetical protein
MTDSIYSTTKIRNVSVCAIGGGGIEISLLHPRGTPIARLILDSDQVRAVAVEVLQVVADELTGPLGYFKGADLKMGDVRGELEGERCLFRRRCAAAIRALPSVVLGPVESPPWKRQRRLPGSTLTRQGVPFRVQAPQRGRSFRWSGEPSPASPSSASRLHLPPIPQAESEQVRSRRASRRMCTAMLAFGPE